MKTMSDKELMIAMARISHEMCNAMPRDTVLFFAEGLTRRHENIPARTQRFLDAVADLVRPGTTNGPKLTVIQGGPA
jgi:hypothetical protein